jgi:hypothetical protein
MWMPSCVLPFFMELSLGPIMFSITFDWAVRCNYQVSDLTRGRTCFDACLRLCTVVSALQA